jgi:hypothetical protein
MKTIAESVRTTLCHLILTGIVTLALAAGAAAQTVVVGTGNPDIDVPAVQAAVDQGGEVVLKGHFSFDRPPTVRGALGGLSMVLVSKAVAISGVQDDDDEMTSIAGGTRPFYVEAPGAAVTIQRLRFMPSGTPAIRVFAVRGLVIASCKIFSPGAPAGINIGTTVNPPDPNTNPGHPENISGTLLIANNEIDVPGTSLDATVGILIFSVGVPGAEVDLHISGNTITNSTERAIDIVRVGGRASIVQNTVTTSTTLGPVNNGSTGRGTDVISARGLGSFLVAGNSVHSRWAAASGIRLVGLNAVWPLIGAVVIDNDVDMEAPEGTVFDDNSAGIVFRGYGERNVVANNRVRGRAKVALEVISVGTSVLANNDVLLNRVDDFEPTLADIFVADGVTNTLIVGEGTVEDHGIGTVIVPVAGRGENKDKNHR